VQGAKVFGWFVGSLAVIATIIAQLVTLNLQQKPAGQVAA
jgi:hypothetical protein